MTPTWAVPGLLFEKVQCFQILTIDITIGVDFCPQLLLCCPSTIPGNPEVIRFRVWPGV